MTEKYVVFDGMDGSGKGTQIELLQQAFSDLFVAFVREPGGTPFAEEIRELVRDNPLAGQSTALNNFLLFWAAREELQHNLIALKLRSGKHVFSDRGDSSTFAFQLCGEEHEELFGVFSLMRKLVFSAKQGRRAPDLYIVFDLPAHTARERALQDANRTTTHFDVRSIQYYERVREGFRTFAKHYPQTRFVDAARTREEIHHDVLELLRGIGVH